LGGTYSATGSVGIIILQHHFAIGIIPTSQYKSISGHRCGWFNPLSTWSGSRRAIVGQHWQRLDWHTHLIFLGDCSLLWWFVWSGGTEMEKREKKKVESKSGPWQSHLHTYLEKSLSFSIDMNGATILAMFKKSMIDEMADRLDVNHS